MYVHYEKWLPSFYVVDIHLVALPSVKGHTLCFFDTFTHQSVATDKMHSFSQLVCTHSSIDLHNIHQHLGRRQRPQAFTQRTHLGAQNLITVLLLFGSQHWCSSNLHLSNWWAKTSQVRLAHSWWYWCTHGPHSLKKPRWRSCSGQTPWWQPAGTSYGWGCTSQTGAHTGIEKLTINNDD